ncbi:MAG: paraquat-inducible protein A, partial [Thermodesulfobacteriota bacterium]
MLNRIPAVPDGGSAVCRRCGAVLYTQRQKRIECTLSFAVAGLILMILANLFPFLGFKIQGQVQQTILFSGIQELYRQGLHLLAILVFFTTIAAPLIHFVILIYVLFPLILNRRAPGMFQVYRLYHHLRPWGMLEVFMLGILVSVVKLSRMAEIIPGTALYCFMALIF